MISEMFKEIADLHEKASRTELAEQKQRAAEEDCARWRKLAEELGTRVGMERRYDRSSLHFVYEIDVSLLHLSRNPEALIRDMLARAYEEFHRATKSLWRR